MTRWRRPLVDFKRVCIGRNVCTAQPRTFCRNHASRTSCPSDCMAVCHPFRTTLTSRSISACRERTLFRSVLANGLGSRARNVSGRDYAAQPSRREKSQEKVWRMTKALACGPITKVSVAARLQLSAAWPTTAKGPSGSLRLPRASACSHSEHGRTRLRVAVRALRLPCRRLRDTMLVVW